MPTRYAGSSLSLLLYQTKRAIELQSYFQPHVMALWCWMVKEILHPKLLTTVQLFVQIAWAPLKFVISTEPGRWNRCRVIAVSWDGPQADLASSREPISVSVRFPNRSLSTSCHCSEECTYLCRQQTSSYSIHIVTLPKCKLSILLLICTKKTPLPGNVADKDAFQAVEKLIQLGEFR